jgi:hypothetical protein
MVRLRKVPLQWNRSPPNYDKFKEFLKKYKLAHLTDELWIKEQE